MRLSSRVSQSTQYRVWMVVLTLATFALRIAEASLRTFWLDESLTLDRAADSWSGLLSGRLINQGIIMMDVHPPLYFAAIKVWIAIAGTNEFALRTLSVLCMTAVVPLTWALGTRMFGRRAGLIAGLIAATNPAYQWFGWEVRMYGALAVLATLSCYLFARAVLGARIRRPALGAWLGVSLVSMATHYTFASLIAAQSVFLAWALARRATRRQLARAGAAAALLAAALVALYVLPGASAPLRRIATGLPDVLASPVFRSIDQSAVIHEVLNASFFGMNASDPTNGWLELALQLLIVLSIALPFSRAQLDRRGLLGLLVCMPLVLATALSFFIEHVPSFRYVMVMVPAVHVALARLAAWLLQAGRRVRWPAAARMAGALTAVVVVGSQSFGTAFALIPSASWQDDWRGFARHIRTQWQPGDVLVINVYTPATIVRQYLGDLPIDIIYANQLLGRAASPGDLGRELAAKYRRVWHANTGSDGGADNPGLIAILQAFDVREKIRFAARTNIIELVRYDLTPSTTEGLPTGAVTVDSGPPASQTRLAGYAIEPGSPYASPANMRLSLFWRRGSAPDQDFAVSARLLSQGALWMDWMFPASLEWLPRACVAGRVCRADYMVELPPGLPGLPYDLELQTRSGAKQEVIQQTVTPLPAALAACCVRELRDAPAAALHTLAGVDVLRVEVPPLPHPGESLPVVLTWRARQAHLPAWQTELRLQPLIGAAVAGTVRQAGTPAAPPDTWPAGEAVRDQYTISIPPRTTPGWYRLSLSRDGAEATHLAFIQIEDYPRTTPARSPQVMLNARANELILRGYAFDAPPARGGTYDVHLLWQVESPPARDGVFFLHVFGPDGKLVSQDDSPPEGGKRSTQTFHAGDGLDQVHRVTLGPDLAAGEYTMLAGVYDRSGGERWGAAQDGLPARDNLIRVGAFSLK